METGSVKNKKIRFHVVAVLVVVALVWTVFQLTGLDDVTALTQYAVAGPMHDQPWLAVLILAALMVLCALTPLPAEIVAVASGMVLGPWLGSLVTWSSAMLGAHIAFIYGRYLRRQIRPGGLSEARHAQWRLRIQSWMQRWGQAGFLLARLVPVVPFFALNITAAFLPIRTRNYLLITAIAILPHVLLINFFGAWMLSE